MKDITYCSKSNCKHKECDRNIKNLPSEERNDHEILLGEFLDCEHWKES